MASLTVVGSVNVDVTAVTARLPSPGEAVAGGQLRREAGGKGANQAAAASRLGAHVRMVGAVGDDGDGVWMRNELQDAGVDTSALAVVEGATGIALVIVNESEYELLPELRDARSVAVTYGKNGAALYERGIRVAFAPAVKTTAINSVGAGDAFCAALTLAICSGYEPAEGLRVACAVGAAAVADPRSQPLLGRLARYGSPTSPDQSSVA